MKTIVRMNRMRISCRKVIVVKVMGREKRVDFPLLHECESVRRDVDDAVNEPRDAEVAVVGQVHLNPANQNGTQDAETGDRQTNANCVDDPLCCRTVIAALRSPPVIRAGTAFAGVTALSLLQDARIGNRDAILEFGHDLRVVTLQLVVILELRRIERVGAVRIRLDERIHTVNPHLVLLGGCLERDQFRIRGVLLRCDSCVHAPD